MTQPDFTKLKELLEQESYPLRFTFKFIGKGSNQFEAGVLAFEAAYPELALQSKRASSGGNHLAMTYAFDAQDAEEIVEIFKEIGRIPDLLMIL